MTRKANSETEVILLRDLEGIKDAHPYVDITYPTPGKITEFHIHLPIFGGIWDKGKFVFKVVIPIGWPITRPKVTILTRIWHPNIVDKEENPEGAVCLNILKEAYQPTIKINAKKFK